MSNCRICGKVMNTGNPLDRDCGGDCTECMAEFGDPGCMETRGFVNGFKAACKLLREDGAVAAADDLESRIGETDA